MAEAAALRQALAIFLGPERFRKFIQQFRPSKGLRYWQEQEWSRFLNAHPDFAIAH